MTRVSITADGFGEALAIAPSIGGQLVASTFGTSAFHMTHQDSWVARNSFFPWREDGFPIILHTDYSSAVLLCLGHERVAQTSGTGIGPKNIRRAFSFPITSPSS